LFVSNQQTPFFIFVIKQNQTSISWNGYSEQRIHPNLDGLRGLAILLVLVHHTPKFDLGGLWLNGRMGVAIFFAISGFLICSLFYREVRKHDRVHLKAFFVRRFARLMPLYYAVLAFEAFLVLWLKTYSPENQDLFVYKLPSYLFYYSNWLEVMTQGPFFVAWSLAVEEQFYLVFAFVFAFWRKWIAPLALLLLAIKIYLTNHAGFPVLMSELPWRIILSYSEPILLGVGLAVILEHRSSFERVAGILSHRASLLGSSAVVLIMIFAVPVENTTSWTAQLFYVATILMIGGMVLAGPLPVLHGNLMRSVGRVSYCIYLIHMPVYNVLKRFSEQHLWLLVVGGAVTYGIALLSYRFFETPWIKLGRKVSKRLIASSS
jgi:peptidoglycan/LPS O-acetylase OafA/YrhL